MGMRGAVGSFVLCPAAQRRRDRPSPQQVSEQRICRSQPALSREAQAMGASFFHEQDGLVFPLFCQPGDREPAIQAEGDFMPSNGWGGFVAAKDREARRRASHLRRIVYVRIVAPARSSRVEPVICSCSDAFSEFYDAGPSRVRMQIPRTIRRCFTDPPVRRRLLPRRRGRPLRLPASLSAEPRPSDSSRSPTSQLDQEGPTSKEKILTTHALAAGSG